MTTLRSKLESVDRALDAFECAPAAAPTLEALIGRGGLDVADRALSALAEGAVDPSAEVSRDRARAAEEVTRTVDVRLMREHGPEDETGSIENDGLDFTAEFAQIALERDGSAPVSLDGLAEMGSRPSHEVTAVTPLDVAGDLAALLEGDGAMVPSSEEEADEDVLLVDDDDMEVVVEVDEANGFSLPPGESGETTIPPKGQK